MSGGIIDSLGVEIEFTSLPQDSVAKFLQQNNIRANVTNDASCTRTTLNIGDLGVDTTLLDNNHRVGSWARRTHRGGEFVSAIITSQRTDKQWFNPLAKTIRYLSEHGEKPSLVTGVHVHLNAGGAKTANIEFLKSMLLIWSKVEAAIYRLTAGELGYSRGGKHMQYCYYRPLVPHNGPAVVRNHEGVATPCFELQRVLKSETKEEFFAALGRGDMAHSKYWATKYHALNLHSLLSKGTVEFRTANFTNQPRYLYAWIRMYQQMMALAFASYAKPLSIQEYPDLPLGYNGSFSLSDFISILCLQDGEVIEILEELWDSSTWEEPVKGYQWSHLGYGVGRNMPETLVDFRGLKNQGIIPTVVPGNETIYRPDAFISDQVVMPVQRGDGAVPMGMENVLIQRDALDMGQLQDMAARIRRRPVVDIIDQVDTETLETAAAALFQGAA